jgi:hypothetical protein
MHTISLASTVQYATTPAIGGMAAVTAPSFIFCGRGYEWIEVRAKHCS